MKERDVYVAVRPNGMYLIIGERQTHTGHHVDISETVDIDYATTFSVPRLSREAGHNIKGEYIFVPAQKRYETILKGFGLS